MEILKIHDHEYKIIQTLFTKKQIGLDTNDKIVSTPTNNEFHNE